MGDFHNSKRFPEDFLKYVYAEVELLCHKFLTSRMVQTGFYPCLNIQADKGTSCHRTMQFTTAVVAVADRDVLLANMFLGHPIVRDGTAEGLAQSICDEILRHGISPEQVEGFTPDGQYVKWGVPEIIQKKLGLGPNFRASWDALHRYKWDILAFVLYKPYFRAGVIDTHLRKHPDYQWMVDVHALCKDLYNKFNFGKNAQVLIDICEEMEVRMKQLQNFSTTRFANSIRRVTMNLRDDFHPVVQSLLSIEKDLDGKGGAQNQEKLSDARRLIKAIYNKDFALKLSGISDLYDIFGRLANEVQTVDLLPHER